MKNILPVFLIIITLSLTSCVSQFMTSSLKPQSIREATIINPASYIELIPKGKGNRTIYSDSLTKIANKNIESGILDYLSGHFKVNTIELDSATNELVDFQSFQMVKMIQTKGKIELVEIPPSIDSIMDSNDIDFAVVSIHSGFSREKGNYGAQVIKGLLLGVVTLGTVYTVPVKSVSDLTICIIDRNNNNIAFHNRNNFQDLDPIDKTVTDKQIQKTFEKYFNTIN